MTSVLECGQIAVGISESITRQTDLPHSLCALASIWLTLALAEPPASEVMVMTFGEVFNPPRLFFCGTLAGAEAHGWRTIIPGEIPGYDQFVAQSVRLLYAENTEGPDFIQGSATVGFTREQDGRYSTTRLRPFLRPRPTFSSTHTGFP